MENSLMQVQQYFTQDNIKSRFEAVLKDKAPQFMTSITNAIRNNNSLQKCDSQSIISAALVAATYDLPIDSNLGFSALVPYNDKNDGYRAQFQMMYKGFVQLAIRSGAYEKMNVSEVYEDEFVDYSPITGELNLHKGYIKDGCRAQGDTSKIVGYYAWFKLMAGFQKDLYMTVEEITNHAKRYSASYKRDLNQKRSSSKWTTDFEAMAKKTVLKLLLSKWGILSIDMQRAIQDDQKIYDSEGNENYGDNPEKNMPDAYDPFGNSPDDDMQENYEESEEKQNDTDQ